jgi:hypothetical protein
MRSIAVATGVLGTISAFAGNGVKGSGKSII